MSNMENPRIELHKKTVKTVVRKNNLPDPFTMSLYSFTPYQGCSHQCTYCDGRAEKYFVEGDFNTDIVVRENTVDILKKELGKLKRKGIISIGSGTTDSYQHAEKDMMIVRESGRLISESIYPVQIITKSSLILRDIEIWETVKKRNGFILLISLVFLDDNKRKIFEPHASSVDERLSVIKEFKARGFPVGILMMPLLPEINDDLQNIEKLVRVLRNLEVDFIVPGHLTLRPGVQKNQYLKLIKDFYPEKLAFYEKIYSENRSSGNSIYSYRSNLYTKIYNIFKRYGINDCTPHYIFKGLMTRHDEVYVLLSHLKKMYYNHHKHQRIDTALNRYREWFLSVWESYKKKKDYNNDIDLILKFLLENGSLNKVISDEEITGLIKSTVLENKILDYQKMEFYTH